MPDSETYSRRAVRHICVYYPCFFSYFCAGVAIVSDDLIVRERNGTFPELIYYLYEGHPFTFFTLYHDGFIWYNQSIYQSGCRTSVLQIEDPFGILLFSTIHGLSSHTQTYEYKAFNT